MSNVTDLRKYRLDRNIKKTNKIIQDAKKELDENRREKIRAVCITTLAALDKGLPTKNIITTFKMCVKLYMPKIIS